MKLMRSLDSKITESEVSLEYFNPEWPKTLAGCLDYTDLYDNEPKAKGENGSSQSFSL